MRRYPSVTITTLSASTRALMLMGCLVVVLAVMVVTVEARGGDKLTPNDVFTNSFLVRLHRSVDHPEEVARKHGFHYMGKVS